MKWRNDLLMEIWLMHSRAGRLTIFSRVPSVGNTEPSGCSLGSRVEMLFQLLFRGWLFSTQPLCLFGGSSPSCTLSLGLSAAVRRWENFPVPEGRAVSMHMALVWSIRISSNNANITCQRVGRSCEGNKWLGQPARQFLLRGTPDYLLLRGLPQPPEFISFR